MTPIRPARHIVQGSTSHRLIRGVLRMDVGHPFIERITLLHMDGWSLSIVDSGDGTSWTAHGDTTLHILWQADEESALVTVAGERFPIASGDTMSVPAGSEISVSARMLLVRIEANSATLPGVHAPSHGTDSFVGYNRRTTYETPSSFALERWKITQPLTLPAARLPFAIVDLATPLALSWSGGTDLIERGDARIIDPSTGPVTLLPDGLGYALVVASEPFRR